MTPETTEPNPPRTLGAVMSAEAGYEEVVEDTPIRVSGFVALILALLSGFTIVALPMVGLAVAAVFVGLFALRRSGSDKVPVGTTAARVAICLAVLFGCWGVARAVFKTNTLASQAETFAREFAQVAGSGNEAYTAELFKSYVNRYDRSMDLKLRYAEDKAAQERARQNATEPGAASEPTPVETAIDLFASYGGDHEWILDRPVHVYHHYGRQMAEVVLADDRSKNPKRVRIILELLKHKDRGTHEWHVDSCSTFHKRIVAERVL